jgi:triosephosphate isomerase
VAPPFTAIAACVDAAKGSAIGIAAQNVYWANEGAFTGEVSPRMLVEAGCRGVIIAHSERRQFFGETDESANRKVKAALSAGLTPILCVGEMLADREAGNTQKVLEKQFRGSLAALTTAEFSRIIIAYEPVWAIGTGRTATPEIAAEAHKFLRDLAAGSFTAEYAASLRILYGGSVKPENIKGLMAQADIDGALVGGASLDARQFAAIVNY